jgi:archaellum component FlaG (FlaF/FlaG flagellin family)
MAKSGDSESDEAHQLIFTIVIILATFLVMFFANMLMIQAVTDASISAWRRPSDPTEVLNDPLNITVENTDTTAVEAVKER